ncbi:adenosine kinase 2 isoform X3 [Ooceraea biroi]|nr:adenosine kinase 2 isoform X3 [Ooceraea biroi]
MRVAQWFLQKPRIATYMGCVGRDKYSEILEDKATTDGLNVRYQYTDKEATGMCAVLITGKERSLCANLAAANCFSPSHIENPENKQLIDIAKYIYISGFFLTVSPESIQAVAKRAYENDKMFMMNLSAPFLCEFFRQPMLAALPYVDILFGNETEAETFAKVNNLDATDRKQIALKISEMEKINNKRKRIVVITQGAEAVLLAKDGRVTEHPVTKLPQDKVIDTNGAGDAFVGGTSVKVFFIATQQEFKQIINRENRFFRLPRTAHTWERYRDVREVRHLGGDADRTEVRLYLRGKAKFPVLIDMQLLAIVYLNKRF